MGIYAQMRKDDDIIDVFLKAFIYIFLNRIVKMLTSFIQAEVIRKLSVFHKNKRRRKRHCLRGRYTDKCDLDLSESFDLVRLRILGKPVFPGTGVSDIAV